MSGAGDQAQASRGCNQATARCRDLFLFKQTNLTTRNHNICLQPKRRLLRHTVTKQYAVTLLRLPLQTHSHGVDAPEAAISAPELARGNNITTTIACSHTLSQF
jgi:hypothetical protein